MLALDQKIQLMVDAFEQQFIYCCSQMQELKLLITLCIHKLSIKWYPSVVI